MTDLERNWVFLASTPKLPVQDDKIRKGYYAASDGIVSLGDAIKRDPNTKRDQKLAAAVRSLDAALDKVSNALSSYNWD